jgi:hypothetical protein
VVDHEGAVRARAASVRTVRTAHREMQRHVVAAGVAAVVLALVCAMSSGRRLASESELVSQLPGESKTAASDYER